MTKVQLSELTEKDAENLMNNSTVWQKAIETISEQVSFGLEDFLNALNGCRYSISNSSDRYNCLGVTNPYKFLGSLEDACGWNAGILSDEQINKANALVSDYENSEDDDQQEQLEYAMDKLANAYADTLWSDMVAEYDVIYDKNYVKGFMIDELEYAYPEDAYYSREDNSIYYLTKD